MNNNLEKYEELKELLELDMNLISMIYTRPYSDDVFIEIKNHEYIGTIAKTLQYYTTKYKIEYDTGVYTLTINLDDMNF